jgi:thiamine biosynthesis lipoprotein
VSGQRLVFPVMGTMSSISVPDSEAEQHGRATVDLALREAKSELERLDHRFSHYSAASDISRWQAGHSVGPDTLADIMHVLDRCQELEAESAGAFRIKDPRTGALDTAGYVKGYAIGRAAEVLRHNGLSSFAVGVGGDAYFSGRPAGDRPWNVAVQHPARRYGVAAVVAVTDAAVATSGTTERGDHIWVTDGASRTGDIVSFTVIGPSIAQADAFATAGFAMGEDGMAWVARHEGYRSVVVRADRSVQSDAALVSAA